MAQRPAVSKPLRAFRLMLAGCGVAPDHLGELQPSEQAALALRRTRSASRAALEVVFLIPMVGPAHVGDWAAVCQRLGQTLAGFQAQDNPNWRAVVCCQKDPGLPPDERISWLPFDDPTPGNDKWRKLTALAEYLPELPIDAAHVMSFDADDLLRQGVVGEMLGNPDQDGWLVETGYVRDEGSGDIGLAGPRTLARPLRKPFWKLCGSCCALRWQRDCPETTFFLREMYQHEHRMFPYLAALAGYRVRPLARPSVLYALNHGENFGARRGRVGFKTRFVQRFRVSEPAELAEIETDF